MAKFNLIGITRQQLLDALADLYGYSEEDFSELTVSQIYQSLSDEQIAKIDEYLTA